MSRLVILSKSPASPAIRREHALAALATADGIDVVFIERPSDIRSARHTPGAWLRALVKTPAGEGRWGRQVTPAVVVPGHLGRVAAALSTRMLGRVLRAEARPGDTVCVMAPWDWPAVGRLTGVRRVFDCADDWPALIPGRAHLLETRIARAAAEADEVVVASPKLAAAFRPRRVTLVRNAASRECLASPALALPSRARGVYVGTLTERIDTGLIGAALDRNPDLSIALYGPCAYAGQGAEPAPELAALLDTASRQAHLAWVH